MAAVLAVVQTDVKRMLAYSSITHAGFMLVGVQAASDRGTAAVLFYLAAYTFMVVGRFAVVTVVAAPGDSAHDSTSTAGWPSAAPPWPLAFTVLLLGQAGVPAHVGLLRQVRRHRRRGRRPLLLAGRRSPCSPP